MTERVNPPAQLKIPEQFQKDQEVLRYFQDKDFIIFQLWRRSGGSQDLLDGIRDPGPSQFARLTAIEQRLGSGDALTSDETGFTVDSTVLSVDMDES